MSTLHPLDPLTMPLRGSHIIEASAGTGKTWTLAALYVRLVLGHDPAARSLGPALYPPQILVMTFTEAATAELRSRIRQRLAQSAAHFRAQAGAKADDFLRRLSSQIDPESWPQAADRLELAAQWMDEAAIHTIHGWSHRMLRQHAFDSGSLFRQSRADNSEALRLSAVRDYWRQWFYPLSTDMLPALAGIGHSPEEFHQKLLALWRQAERAPAEAMPEPISPDAVLADWQQWQAQHQALQAQAQQAWAQHAHSLRPRLARAMEEDLNGQTYRKAMREAYLQALDQWSLGAGIDDAILKRFALQQLIDKTKTGRPKPVDTEGVLGLIQGVVDSLDRQPQPAEAILAHAAVDIAERYQRLKREQAQFDFSDLLQQLYHALQAPDGRLAQAIREQYPVALVDEFQDTDPWQYGALSRIYLDALQEDAEAVGLIMIGDPKQAIYGFRGADLPTYLSARARALGIYTLSGNFRSTRGLVEAVNHIFSQADRPFGEIAYTPVQACNPDVLPLNGDEHAWPAVTVWHQASDKPLNKTQLRRDMAELCASQMVDLLHQGVATPGDMAVLVRDGAEARAIRAALAQRQVRSVYLSEKDNVFASPEALDLWRLLRALAHPRRTDWVKAVIGSSLWGLAWDEVEALIQDDDAWEALLDRLHGWRLVWQRQGLMPMLYACLHDQGIPARWLAQTGGERRLTNLLHLGDLLQNASFQLQGEQALIRYLEEQIREDRRDAEAAQLRLESDAKLVQVVSMHKSKGLQYPLVFMPFASASREPDEAHGLSEEVRLFYVAMTRAERALWLGVVASKGDLDGAKPVVKSPVSVLLARQDAHDLAQRLQAWAQCPQIRVVRAPMPTNAAYTPPDETRALVPARQPQRVLSNRWWTASFTSLTQDLQAISEATSSAPLNDHEQDQRWQDAQIDNPPTDDLSESVESEPVSTPRFNAFPAGSQYGTCLHDMLEWQAVQGWPLAQAPAVAHPMAREWNSLIERMGQALSLTEAELALVPDWIRALISTPLPIRQGVCMALCDLPASAFWAEMGFHLPVHQVQAETLDALITCHIHPGLPRPALKPKALHGMLTGFMDLVFQHQGQYYVLDHKSNRLPGYGLPELTNAILAHRYDVQYTLYVLALHRLLKVRLPGYDYDRDMGGVVYLFLRGIDQPGHGVYAHKPPRVLIESLDRVFQAQNPSSHTELAR